MFLHAFLPCILLLCGATFLALYIVILQSLVSLANTSSSYILLASLAVGDIGHLWFTVYISVVGQFLDEKLHVQISFTEISAFTNRPFMFDFIWHRFDSFLFNLFWIPTSYHYTLVALNRLIAMCFPLLAYRATIRHFVCLSSAVWALGFLHNLIIHALPSFTPFYVSPTGVGFVPANMSSAVNNTSGSPWFDYWYCHTMVAAILPIIIYSTGIVFMFIQRVQTNRRAQQTHKTAVGQAQLRITACCFVNTCAFLVYCLSLLDVHLPNLGRYSPWFTSLAGCMNAAVNPICYMVVSHSIREETLRRLCRRPRRAQCRVQILVDKQQSQALLDTAKLELPDQQRAASAML